MEKTLIAKDLLNKFIKYELTKNKYNNNYTKSTQSMGKHSNWQKCKNDGKTMEEVLNRNLHMWSEYAYGGMNYQEIANKFDLSYGWTIGIVNGMNKSYKFFSQKVK
tara:strand:- start:302 stop:619 length:318 start_codon:yes stop_codon:yes gene_type:complete